MQASKCINSSKKDSGMQPLVFETLFEEPFALGKRGKVKMLSMQHGSCYGSIGAGVEKE